MTGTWASGFVTGDIVTAAEYKKSTGAIFDSTLGGAAASIDVTSILATYAHLRLEFSGRGDTAAATVAVMLRFNNDSAANYDYQTLSSSAAATNSAETFAATQIVITAVAGSTAGASLTGHAAVDILNYAGTTFNKVVTGIGGVKGGVGTGGMIVYRVDGHWRNSAAINRVTVLPITGNFIAGTRLTVYALGA